MQLIFKHISIFHEDHENYSFLKTTEITKLNRIMAEGYDLVRWKKGC